mgnify:FL=1
MNRFMLLFSLLVSHDASSLAPHPVTENSPFGDCVQFFSPSLSLGHRNSPHTMVGRQQVIFNVKAQAGGHRPGVPSTLDGSLHIDNAQHPVGGATNVPLHWFLNVLEDGLLRDSVHDDFRDDGEVSAEKVTEPPQAIV